VHHLAKFHGCWSKLPRYGSLTVSEMVAICRVGFVVQNMCSHRKNVWWNHFAIVLIMCRF